MITASGTVDSQSVFATASYHFSANTLVLIVENDLDNPKSVAQGISGFDFHLSGGLTGSLLSATGDLVSIARNGTFTTAAASVLDWSQTSGFFTTAIGSSGPDQLILGEPAAGNLYSNAKGSIAGNKPHNPFVRSEAVFVYAIPGATPLSGISEFSFYFGTDSQRVSAIVTREPIHLPPSIPGAVPEAGTMGLLGSGLVAFAALRRTRS